MNKLLILSVILGISTAAFADRVWTNGEMCDRGITYDNVTDAERADLNSGKQVTRFVKDSDGYVKGYVMKLADFDAELVMGLFSSCNEHKGNLGGYIEQSKITKAGNPFEVFYEQHVDWPYDNGRYTLENKVSSFETASGKGYLLNSRLLSSTDASFSPIWLDAYLRVMPIGKSVFVVACNYMVPRGDSFKGKFNDTAKSRLKGTGNNLLKWISKVSSDRSKADAYRERLKALLEAGKRK